MGALHSLDFSGDFAYDDHERLRGVPGRGNPEPSGTVPTGMVPILDVWSGSLWRMSRFSELKAAGTGLG